MAKIIWKGNYLEPANSKTEHGWDIVTLVEFVGELGECRVRLVPENALPFKPKWHPMSKSGYHQAANIPEPFPNHELLSTETADSVVRWNARYPENGAVFLFPTREERDRFLNGDA